jgi:hypothetical protein
LLDEWFASTFCCSVGFLLNLLSLLYKPFSFV